MSEKVHKRTEYLTVKFRMLPKYLSNLGGFEDIYFPTVCFFHRYCGNIKLRLNLHHNIKKVSLHIIYRSEQFFLNHYHFPKNILLCFSFPLPVTTKKIFYLLLNTFYLSCVIDNVIPTILRRRIFR